MVMMGTMIRGKGSLQMWIVVVDSPTSGMVDVTLRVVLVVIVISLIDWRTEQQADKRDMGTRGRDFFCSTADLHDGDIWMRFVFDNLQL
jgi:hypothetical protein